MVTTKKAAAKATKKKTTARAKQRKRTTQKKVAQPTTPEPSEIQPYPDILELVARSRKCTFDYRKGDLVQNIMPHPSRGDVPIYGRIVRVCKESLVIHRSDESGVLHVDLGNVGGPKVDTVMKAAAKLIERCQQLGKVRRINIRPMLGDGKAWVTLKRSPDFVYINTAYAGLEASPLANPHAVGTASAIGPDSKAQAKQQYEADLKRDKDTGSLLWQTVEHLGRRVAQGEDLRLGCFCEEGDICHGDSLIPHILSVAEVLKADK